ncbi:MAG: hypothetical protein WC635_05045 [Bacteriovorax sp.]|jgi:hypothetical protein
MKLKSTIAALLLATSMSSFALDLTLSPVVTVVQVVRSALGTALSPFASTTAALGGQALAMQAVRNDALTFLADGESTDRLSASFTELRKVEGLESKSDSDLSKLIILSVE